MAPETDTSCISYTFFVSFWMVKMKTPTINKNSIITKIPIIIQVTILMIRIIFC